ncbi:RasGEF domain protein [Caenorhabditis elegans]|uniref:RasGEF domain protein n=1 Tax=Caenorhabditis elegans TaxID=6239 RepID=Q19212_CAEEL|nr:RasGEF domain protein [Caenorhabditis elegans]CAA91455.2 RasGEF domain protein [Caenorhabditis elegans]|eukprot:NP_509887.2 Uncharacterized protein CELE_F08G12.3 [Caenorhabditis elegans]
MLQSDQEQLLQAQQALNRLNLYQITQRIVTNQQNQFVTQQHDQSVQPNHTSSPAYYDENIRTRNEEIDGAIEYHRNIQPLEHISTCILNHINQFSMQEKMEWLHDRPKAVETLQQRSTVLLHELTNVDDFSRLFGLMNFGERQVGLTSIQQEYQKIHAVLQEYLQFQQTKTILLLAARIFGSSLLNAVPNNQLAQLMYTFPKPEGAMQTLNYNVHNGLGPSTLSSPGKIKEKKSFTQYRKINERFSQTKSPTLYTNIFGETSMSVMNAANAIRSWEDRKAVAEHIHTYVEKKSLLHEFVRKISNIGLRELSGFFGAARKPLPWDAKENQIFEMVFPKLAVFLYATNRTPHVVAEMELLSEHQYDFKKHFKTANKKKYNPNGLCYLEDILDVFEGQQRKYPNWDTN